MARSTTTRRKPRKRSSTARKKSSGGGGLWPWVVALVLVAGAIAAYDNREKLPRMIAAYLPKTVHSSSGKPAENAPGGGAATPRVKADAKPAQPAKPVDRRDSGPVPPAPVGTAPGASPVAVPVPGGRPGDASSDGKGFTGKFYFCGTSGLDNCVVSGDSFWFRKGRIVLADVVAPATEDAKCQQERDKGFAAKVRLRDLLNAGSFEFSQLKGQNVPTTGPAMRVVTRNGRSLGATLVAEGLARPRFGRQQSWCP